MKVKTIALLAGLAVGSAFADWPAEVRVAHPERYRCGETAEFEVRLHDAKAKTSPTNGTVTAVLSNYGSVECSRQEIDLSTGATFRVSGKLDEPGFLLLTLSGEPVRRNWGGGTHVCSVAYEPEKLTTGIARPEDFDAYWDGECARLEREVPLDAREEPVDLKDKAAERRDLYRVSFATFNGRRVWGFLSIPKDRSKGPFPARVNVPGAGPGQCGFNAEGDDTEIVLHLNVHYYEPALERGGNAGACAAEAKELAGKFGGPAGSYAITGCGSSRENYFYHDCIVGLARAVCWLYARPEVDRERFTYAGTSQGGGLGLILGGLTGKFTRLVAYVPALADHFAYRKGRRAGWPRFHDYRAPDSKYLEAAEAVMPYFDSAFFAARITCPIRFVVGLSDSVCPPATGMTAYNLCPSKDKAIELVPNMTHAVSGEIYRKYDAWCRERGIAPQTPGSGIRVVR